MGLINEKSKKNCGDEKIVGGRYLWRCIREPHKDDRPDSHVYEVVKEIAEKSSSKVKSQQKEKS